MGGLGADFVAGWFVAEAYKSKEKEEAGSPAGNGKSERQVRRQRQEQEAGPSRCSG
jgi:hypothetical protein